MQQENISNIVRMGRELTHREIVEWLNGLHARSHCPYSHYAVGAVIRVQYNGEPFYFAGANVENADASLGTHGEDGACAAMVSMLGGGAEIAEVWVMGARQDAPPDAPAGTCCGRCRQRLSAFAAPETKIHSVRLDGDMTTRTMAGLLPASFSYKNLGLVSSATPDRQPVPLIKAGPLTENDIFEWLEQVGTVDLSSSVRQAVALELDNGAYVAGGRIEDAAYTGINAAQAARAIATAQFGLCRIKAVYAYGSDNMPPPLSAVQVINEGGDGTAVPVFTAV